MHQVNFQKSIHNHTLW